MRPPGRCVLEYPPCKTAWLCPWLLSAVECVCHVVPTQVQSEVILLGTPVKASAGALHSEGRS